MLTQKPVKSTPKRKPDGVPFLKVVRSFKDKTKGRIFLGAASFPCALGRSGMGIKKREGDGISPKGRFALKKLHVRRDKLGLAGERLGARRIRKTDWWADDVKDRHYNTLVRTRAMPAGSKEGLWRDDNLYDAFFEIDYNMTPVERHRGSGIFLHLARPGFLPTEGCVAVSQSTMRHILARLGKNTYIQIG